jgi:hypothetical protein
MKLIKSTDEIYPAITDALEKATRPHTAPELMAHPEVFKVALDKWHDKGKAGEKLSDTLGFMWRRGVLDRFPAPPSHQMARYAYGLAGRFDANGDVIRYEPPATKNRGDVAVVEKDGEIVIELSGFTIVVKPK